MDGPTVTLAPWQRESRCVCGGGGVLDSAINHRVLLMGLLSSHQEE